ncbi:hypothetical protein C9374_009546 [Naegleria lovaniensis]|uniref:UmuC domain-containing protein n=1 Tax=Naegleria lovaniensis TaxID=51637 RepID=A0AA88GYL5_NAELO|nr:uncharacterized protein C9374_009546 [Naegleria lovaniensis]KAG2392969.1 hypothetical protein C9374_009546 [Naegleria lovaniensis]
MLSTPSLSQASVVYSSNSSINPTFMKEHSKYVIIHLDIDCFYAQCEEVENPSYRHVPLGIQQNQTVSTVNYCARIQHGVPKMTRVSKAKEICPQIVIIPARMEIYREMSRKIFEECIAEKVYHQFHGECVLEICGVDEAFVDVTDEVRWRLQQLEQQEQHTSQSNDINGATDVSKESLKRANRVDPNQCVGAKISLSPKSQDIPLNIGSQLAQEIRDEVFQRLGFTLSAGISHSKFLSKQASKKKKPNGQATIYSESFNNEINPLDISIIPNIGYQTREKLVQQLHIRTVQEFRGLSYLNIRKCFNSDKLASQSLNIANGKYDEEYDRVISKGPVKSIGSELTFLPIHNSYDEVDQKLRIITQDLAPRIQRDMQRNQKRFATTLTLKYCHGGYFDKFHSKSCKIDSKCYYASSNFITSHHENNDIHSRAMMLFKEAVPLPFKLQRIAVSVSDFQQVHTNGSSTFVSSQKRTLASSSGSGQQSITAFLSKRVKQ